MLLAEPTAGLVTLELRDVSWSYGPRPVLDRVGLALERAAVAAVTGPNGAGKTSLLRLAAGLLTPLSGTRVAVGSSLYLLAGAGARRRQSVREAVDWVSRVRGRRGESVDDSLRVVGLDLLDRAPVATLSSGQCVRLSLAIALAARPDLLCLDEPTAHLDDAGVELLATVIGLLSAAGSAVLLATPDRERLRGLCLPELRVFPDGKVRQV